MPYSRILKLAFTLTINHPRLWFFGLLLVGGFNAVLLHILGVASSGSDATTAFARIFDIQTQSGLLITAGFIVIIGIVISNIARIIVIHSVLKTLNKEKGLRDFLKLEWLEQIADFDESKQIPVSAVVKRSLISTVVASVCANLFIVAAIAVIGSPQLLFSTHGLRFSVITLVLLLPLSFLALCINLFPPYFSIIFNRSIPDSFRLAYDLLVKKWQEIIGFMIVLLVIYCIGFSIVFTVSQYVQLAVQYIFEIFAHLGFFSISAIISPVRVSGIAVSWLLLAVLNVFANISVLLMFIYLMKPSDSEYVTGFTKAYGIPHHVGTK